MNYDAFIVRRGGGALANAFAVIAVTYPEGSTCTCTKGSKVIRAKDTSGQYLFSIPETGVWTIKATNGAQTTEKAVEITTKYQFEEIKLYFGLMIVHDGKSEFVWETNGTKLEVLDPNEAGDYHLRMTYTAPSSGPTRYNYFISTPAIDFTDYTDLHIKENVVQTKANGVQFNDLMGTIVSPTQYSVKNPAAVIKSEEQMGEYSIEKTIDISQITGPMYISIYASDWVRETRYLHAYIAHLYLT